MRSPARFVGGWFGGWCCLAAIAGAGPLAGQAGLPGDVTRHIDTVFARFERPGSPGCALGVYRDGRMVYARGYGSAQLELRVGYRIVVESDALVLHAPHLPADRLRPTIRDEFESPALGITLRFTRGAGGQVTGLTVAAGRTQGLRFDRARATSSPALPRGR
jgi:hypothetical protein